MAKELRLVKTGEGTYELDVTNQMSAMQETYTCKVAKRLPHGTHLKVLMVEGCCLDSTLESLRRDGFDVVKSTEGGVVRLDITS